MTSYRMVCVESPHNFGCSNISGNMNVAVDNTSDLLTTSVHSVDTTPAWVFIGIGVCVAIMGVVGIIGNATVICLFLRYRKLQTPANTFVFSLSCTDLLMCIINFPMFATANITGMWPLYPTSCQVTGFVGSLTGYISINTLAAMALDRCSVIKRTKLLPRNASHTHNIIMLLIIWMYSCLWAAFPLVGWGKYVMYGKRTCSFDFHSTSRNNVSFIISIYSLCFSVQLLVIIVCYSSIFTTVHTHNKELCKMQLILANGSIRRTVSRRDLEFKVARLLLFIIFIFCLSWMPYATLALINLFGDTTLVTPVGVALAGLLAKCSTVINPIVYAISHPKFKSCMLLCLQVPEDSARRSYLQSAIYQASFQHTSFRKSNSNVSPPSQV